MDYSKALIKVASELKSSIEGMTKQKALRYVNNILEQFTKGIHSDDSWKPINAFFKQLSSENIDYVIEKADYTKDEADNPSGKTWFVEINFVNDKQKEIKLYGKIQACGAGTVSDPLSKYDIIGYFS